MTSITIPARTASAGSGELCRLTVVGPVKRADLAVPVTIPVGDLLPLLLRQTADDTAFGTAWVLQRLGESPLDPDATAETLDLRDGDLLYLNPAPEVLPGITFDDVAVGVARTISARPDQWRPAFTERLLLGLAVMVLAAVPFGVLGTGPARLPALYLGLAAAVLTIECGLFTRLSGQHPAGVLTGLAACGFAALSGLAARHGLASVLGPDRQDLFWGGVNASIACVAVLIAGRVPIAPFGAVLGTGASAVIGSAAALALHWQAAQAAAALAVVLFLATTPGLRLALRLAGLRVPPLPRNADELGRDVDPEPEATVIRRSSAAAAYLASLTVTMAIVFTAAFLLLVREPGWIGWVLTTVFSVAVLLRAADLAGAWQRVPLAGAGTLGLILVLDSRAAHASAPGRVIVVLALLGAVAVLLSAARRGPAGRALPVWGHTAGLLETWTAIALVPLLAQVLHWYAFFRSLTG